MVAQQEAIDLAVAASQAADAKKADDLDVLDVSDILGVVDLFVVVTARNERLLKSIADEIEHQLATTLQRKPLRKEGTPASGWMLLDYGDIVCQLFLPEQRSFYALERLWADVPRRDPLTGASLPAHNVAVAEQA